MPRDWLEGGAGARARVGARVMNPNRGTNALEKMELRRPAADSNETSALVELSRQDLEQARVKAMTRASQAMMCTALLFLILVLALVVVVGVMMERLNSTLAEIADAVGPSAVHAAVQGVQASIDNLRGTTGNFLSTSGSVDQMGQSLLVAVGQSVDILNSTNKLASNLLLHPTVSMQLGSPGAR